MGHSAPLASLLSDLNLVLQHLTTSFNLPEYDPLLPSRSDQVSSAAPSLQLHTSLYPVNPPYLSTPQLNAIPSHPLIAPIPGSSVAPRLRSFTDVIRDSILSQPVSRPPRARAAKIGDTTLAKSTVVHRASSKLSHLRTLSTRGFPFVSDAANQVMIPLVVGTCSYALHVIRGVIAQEPAKL